MNISRPICSVARLVLYTTKYTEWT